MQRAEKGRPLGPRLYLPSTSPEVRNFTLPRCPKTIWTLSNRRFSSFNARSLVTHRAEQYRESFASRKRDRSSFYHRRSRRPPRRRRRSLTTYARGKGLQVEPCRNTYTSPRHDKHKVDVYKRGGEGRRGCTTEKREIRGKTPGELIKRKWKPRGEQLRYLAIRSSAEVRKPTSLSFRGRELDDLR